MTQDDATLSAASAGSVADVSHFAKREFDRPEPIKTATRKWPQPINEFDIVTRLRSTRADMIGTCDEQHYNDCQEAADEIARLRDVMYRVVDEDCTVAIQNGCLYADGVPLFSVPCSRTSERTPATHSTPGEGSEPREGT